MSFCSRGLIRQTAKEEWLEATLTGVSIDGLWQQMSRFISNMHTLSVIVLEYNGWSMDPFWNLIKAHVEQLSSRQPGEECGCLGMSPTPSWALIRAPIATSSMSTGCFCSSSEAHIWRPHSDHCMPGSPDLRSAPNPRGVGTPNLIK